MDDRSGRKRKRVTILVILGLILLLAISYLSILSRSPSYLANKFYVTPLPQIQRPNAPPEDTLYEKGMRAFAAKDWATAISSFSSIEESYRFYNRALYYLAHSYIGVKEYQKALEIFNQHHFTSGQYKQQAEWNKLLMEMKLKTKMEMIIVELKRISDDQDHLFRNEAILLLKKLE